MVFVPGPKVEGLTIRQQQALNLLVEGEHTLATIAEEVGVQLSTLWRWRHEKPALRDALQEALAIAEMEARQFAVAKRVKRIEALEEVHAGLRRIIAERRERYGDEDHPGASTGLLVKSYKAIGSGSTAYAEVEWAVDRPLIQALLDVQKQAATELGQWHDRVDLRAQIEVAEPVRVIRFEAQERHPHQDAIDAAYREAAGPLATDILEKSFHELAGWPKHVGHLDPDHVPALRRAIAEAGLDPQEVLTPEQFRFVYGGDE